MMPGSVHFLRAFVATRAATGIMFALMAAAIVLIAGCKRTENPTEAQVPAATQETRPAPRPTTTMTAKAACITPECHAKFATAAHIHGPVAQGSCQSCHQADQGNHTFPLIRTANATCTFCHAVAGTKAHQ